MSLSKEEKESINKLIVDGAFILFLNNAGLSLNAMAYIISTIQKAIGEDESES